MELGQTRSAVDLVPGSVAGVRARAEEWKARGVGADRVRVGLSGVDDDGTWKGDAYDAYLERFERQLLHWKGAGAGLLAGAVALFTWADALEWAQDEADRAIGLWEAAEQQAVTARGAHEAYVRELRVGLGLRGAEVDVPFVDPSGPAHEAAREVLFNARATLEVFARDCAERLDEAAGAAAMPLTEEEAGEEARRAVTVAAVDVTVVQPFQATMDALSAAAQTLGEHPDIILEMLGGVATVVGGGALIVGGGGVSLTGVGAVAGVPAVAEGVVVAGAGAALVGDAAGRWFQESHGAAERVRGVDRGDGRDYAGTFAKGQQNKPWVDKEKIELDKVANDNAAELLRRKTKVDYDGSPQDGRYYDGLMKNDDGPNTYTGVEVKSGSAIDTYNRPGNTQKQFDDAVRAGTPAYGKLNGEEIVITRVETRVVP